MKTFKQFVRETTGFKLTRSLPGGGIEVDDDHQKETGSSASIKRTSLTQKDPKNYNYMQDNFDNVDTKFGPVSRSKVDWETRSNDTQTKYLEKKASTSIKPGTDVVSSSTKASQDITTKKGK